MFSPKYKVALDWGQHKLLYVKPSIYSVVFVCRYCIYSVDFIFRYCIYAVVFICSYCIYKYPLPKKNADVINERPLMAFPLFFSTKFLAILDFVLSVQYMSWCKIYCLDVAKYCNIRFLGTIPLKNIPLSLLFLLQTCFFLISLYNIFFHSQSLPYESAYRIDEKVKGG